MEGVLFDKNVMNILLIGYDSKDADDRGRSDTNILVSINQETKEIIMTSIMRDCYVVIPGHKNNRINAAYAFGGGSLLIETVEKNFQISVNNYAVSYTHLGTPYAGNESAGRDYNVSLYVRFHDTCHCKKWSGTGLLRYQSGRLYNRCFQDRESDYGQNKCDCPGSCIWEYL